MRAVVMRDSKLFVETVPDPEPATGEILARTLACGICGSDLHALKHAEKMVDAARESGVPFTMDLSRGIIMGHEFCAEVVDFGPHTAAAVKRGDVVVSMPLLWRPSGLHGIGYSPEVPGGYGEFMVLSTSLALKVPNGLSPRHAALTEPMAVGVHAVARGRVERSDAILVMGCGPVGLAVIAALRLSGIENIVASDFSPLRRQLAAKMGARTVVNPDERSAFDALRELGNSGTVVFECIGVPGILRQIMRESPRGTRIVVVGVCMEDDVIRPVIGINKEISLQFVFAYTPEEFAQTLRALSEGQIDVAPLITGHVGLDQVPAAFDALAQPNTHAKILVEPAL